MKIKFMFFVLIGLVSTGLYAQKRPTKAEMDASNVIQFGNTIIDLGNYYGQNLRSYESLINTADNNVERLTQNQNVQPYFVDCKAFGGIRNNQMDAYTADLKRVKPFTEKDELVGLVKQAEKETANVLLYCEKLSNYFAKDEYKSDEGFLKYPQLKDSLVASVNRSQLAWREASNLASDAGNRAELVVLKGSKIADFIIPMKTDLKTLENILDQLNLEYSDLEIIKEKVITLSTSVQNNKDITKKDVSKLSDYYYREVYENFYRAIDASVGSLNTIVKRLETNDIDDSLNSHLGALSSEYKTAVEQYNTFVSQ